MPTKPIQPIRSSRLRASFERITDEYEASKVERAQRDAQEREQSRRAVPAHVVEQAKGICERVERVFGAGAVKRRGIVVG